MLFARPTLKPSDYSFLSERLDRSVHTGPQLFQEAKTIHIAEFVDHMSFGRAGQETRFSGVIVSCKKNQKTSVCLLKDLKE